MKLFKIVMVFSFILMLSPAALATNGDNLIGVGPISRAMGGVGIAAPQDAISAVFANPAAMCFGPICNVSETDFAGTLFMPKVDAKITNSSGTIQADSDDKIYAIPAIGVSVPLTKGPRSWRFGLAAYGVTGLGVDYRGTPIDDNDYFNPGTPNNPLVAGHYTQLQIMKFAPAISFLATERLSFGLALHVDYSSLDLGSGSSFNYGFGAQVGSIYKPSDNWSFGINYVTPQRVDHENVLNFGGYSDLELESPHQLGIGAAYEFSGIDLLLELDVKWLGWSSAAGYEDFDWEDQWVYAVGAQYKPTPQLALRVGYNYAKNPVKEHNGFTGTNFVNVQGTTMPTYYYETFRVIGFPAVVEHHITFGAGYEFSNTLSLHMGFMYAFENSVKGTGTDFAGPVTLESTLSETSLDFGIIWRF